MAHTVSDFAILGSVRAASTNTPRETWNAGTVIAGFRAFFDECREDANSWSECISNMEGAESVRLMTIHKSKGLEYHTVVFVEFNDDAFWGNDDDINVFFVALSRARERVYFSFTQDSKGASNIKGFAEKLESANVSFFKRP